MNSVQLLIRSVLYRKSQRGLAEELCIPKTTLNRILQGVSSLNDIAPDTVGEAYHNYPMPEGLSPESSIQVNIPFCLRSEYDDIMKRLYLAFEGTRHETSFRMQEIRKLILEGASYSAGKIFVCSTKLATAKEKLKEFINLKRLNGQASVKYKYWFKHNVETIKILEAAHNSNFKDETSVLQSGIELVFDLKNAIQAIQNDADQRMALEFLLITSATQVAEILFEGGYTEHIPDVTNVVEDTFGTYAGSNFKLLMVASAWPHNQSGMKAEAKQGSFDSNKLSLKGMRLTQRKQQILEALKPKT